MISSIGSQGTMPTVNMRPPAPPPDPEEKFQELDSDGDGALSLEELQTMAEEISEMTGQTVTAEDLLEKMDTDGNGSLEKSEMPQPPEPPQGGGGPPPFVAEDGTVQDYDATSERFQTLDSLLAYLDGAESRTGESLYDLQV